MLDGKEISKVDYGHFGPPNMTHPFDVKTHVDKLTYDQQKPIRQLLSHKLKTMVHVKQIEDMLFLYDIYDVNQEKKICRNISNKGEPLSKISSFASLLVSGLSIGYFLYKKKYSLFMFDSYSQNIYPILGLFIFSYTTSKYLCSHGINYKLLEGLEHQNIWLARDLMHSQAITLTNKLRFEIKEGKL
jgi:hypothetical protein